MKNIKVILVALGLIFVGCSDDDSSTGSNTPAYSLDGTYSLTAATLSESVDDCGSGMDILEYVADDFEDVVASSDGTCGEGCTYTMSDATSVEIIESWEAYCGDEDDDEEDETITDETSCAAVDFDQDGTADGVWYPAGTQNLSGVVATDGSTVTLNTLSDGDDDGIDDTCVTLVFTKQ